jgi:hypothetical protein
MNETELRSRIRHLYETGEIPCDDAASRTWAGRGTGDFCAVCTERIAITETEFEVDLSSGRTLRLHRLCHKLWLEECGSVAESR